MALTAAAARTKSTAHASSTVSCPSSIASSTTTEKGICTEIYQFNALHKLFAQTLNVVVIVKTNSRNRRPRPCHLVQQRSQPNL